MIAEWGIYKEKWILKGDQSFLSLIVCDSLDRWRWLPPHALKVKKTLMPIDSQKVQQLFKHCYSLQKNVPQLFFLSF